MTFLGDGEFDRTDLQADLRGAKWQYMCRTGSNILLRAYGVELIVGDIQPKRGELLAVTPAFITADQLWSYQPAGAVGAAV